MDMTLTKAFRIRNLLKSKLSEYNSLFHWAPKNWNHGTTPTYKETTGLSTELIATRIQELNTRLFLLEIAIKEANNKEAVFIVETIKHLESQIALIAAEIEGARRIPEVKVETNLKTGDQMTFLQDSYITDARLASLKDEVKTLKLKKFDLESKLSAVNGTTHVSTSVTCPVTGKTIDLQRAIDEVLKEW
jgi:hypothetical protein